MKKTIAIMLALLVVIACFAGCSTSSGPSKKQLKNDILEEYYNGSTGYSSFEKKNFKIEKIILADVEDDEYYAKVKVSFDIYMLGWDPPEYNWEHWTRTLEVRYKHYDTGGWVLQSVKELN